MAKKSKFNLPEIKIKEYPEGVADWFMLNETPRNAKYYSHEVACADLFVAYHPYMDAWAYEPSVGAIRADRGMQLAGKTFYFEVDRAKENMSDIEAKIEAYIAHYYELRRRYNDETKARFHVIFDVVNPKQKVVQKRIEDIGKMLDRYKRSNQFAVSSHILLTASKPTDECLFTPHGGFNFHTI